MSQKNPNPDEIYRQKALLERAAPVTLWIYPALKRLPDSKQRTVLAEASLAARKHWLARVTRYVMLIVAIVGVWVVHTERAEWLAPYHRVFPLLVLASILIDHLLTRSMLRSAVRSSAETP